MSTIVENVADPGRSRRRLRTPWAVSGSEAESRAYLQTRLTLLFKLMFWGFVALLAFLRLLYLIYKEAAPTYNNEVYLTAAIGLAVMAYLWRGLLVRREPSLDALHRIDVVFAIGTGVAFAGIAVICFDRRPSGYTCLIYECFVILTRGLIIPSTGRRTAIVSALAYTPIVAAAVALAFMEKQEVAVPAFVAGAVIVGCVTILLSTAGSHIIYVLSRQARAAQQLGQYRLVRKIAEGGMGAVYLAHHSMLRRPTAVKLLLADKVGASLERFEREVQLMSELTHPNTVVVFDYGHSEDGEFFYAMEYLGDGIDLDRLVKVHGPQPSTRVAHILAQVCGALGEAHDRGLVHRDIKPANILLCQRGGMPDVVKVVDFGLVKELTSETGPSQQVILGTPGYIAPETMTDPSAMGPAADLYAVGAVGFFLLTGRRVFDGKTAVDLCVQHMTQPPPAPSSLTEAPIDPALEAIVLRCLAKKPQDRFASAAELASELRLVPNSDGWNIAAARAWWKEHKTVSDQFDISPPPTATISVNLDERSNTA